MTRAMILVALEEVNSAEEMGVIMRVNLRTGQNDHPQGGERRWEQFSILSECTLPNLLTNDSSLIPERRERESI